MPIYLHMAYGCFHATMGDLSSFSADHMCHKAENILSSSLQKSQLSLALKLLFEQLLTMNMTFLTMDLAFFTTNLNIVLPA